MAIYILNTAMVPGSKNFGMQGSSFIFASLSDVEIALTTPDHFLAKWADHIRPRLPDRLGRGQRVHIGMHTGRPVVETQYLMGVAFLAMAAVGATCLGLIGWGVSHLF